MERNRAYHNLTQEIYEGMTLHVDGIPNERDGAVLIGFYGLEGRLELPNIKDYEQYRDSPEVRMAMAKTIADGIFKIMAKGEHERLSVY